MGNRKSVPLGVYNTSKEWAVVDLDPACIIDGYYMLNTPQTWSLTQNEVDARPPPPGPLDAGPPPPGPLDAGPPPPCLNDIVTPPEDGELLLPEETGTPPLEDVEPLLPEDVEPLAPKETGTPPPEDVGPLPPEETGTPPLPPEETKTPPDDTGTPPPKETVGENRPKHSTPFIKDATRTPRLPSLPEDIVYKKPQVLIKDQLRLEPGPTLEPVSEFVKKQVRKNYVRIIDNICWLQPLIVANHLFQRSVISSYDLDYVTNPYHDNCVKAKHLAFVFFQHNLSRHLENILLAFEEAGVETVTEITDKVRLLYPEAFTRGRQGKSSGQAKAIVKQPHSATGAEAICYSPETLICDSCIEDIPNQLDQDNFLELDEQVKTTIKELSAGECGPSAAVEYIRTEIETEEGELLLHKACLYTTDLHTFNLILLATSEALINFINARVCGRTPLHMACSQLPKASDYDESKTKLQLTKITNLLKKQANTSVTDHDGNTPLHLAALRNSAVAVRLILTSNSITINKTNNLGNTALHIACKFNYLDVARALFDHKVKATIPNTSKKSRTPLHQAAARSHSMIANMVLDYDPKAAQCVDKKNMSPLLLASKRGNVGLTDRLVKQSRVNVNVVDNEGKTPLHYACAWGYDKLIDLVLSGNGSREIINHPDCNGDTALHIVSYHRDKRLIHLLRSKKASNKIRNKYGQTPKDIEASKTCTLPYKKATLPRSTSKPCLSHSQSCISLASTVSAQSYSSVCTTATSSYMDTSDEDEQDEKVWNA